MVFFLSNHHHPEFFSKSISHIAFSCEKPSVQEEIEKNHNSDVSGNESKLTVKDLTRLIKKYSGRIITVDEIREVIKKDDIQTSPEELRTQILSLLEDKKPLIQQAFEIPTSKETDSHAEKQIAFRVL